MTQSPVDEPTTPTPGLLDDWLTQDALAKELEVSKDTLQRWHNQRSGPPRVKLGARVLYHKDSVRTWLLGREEKGLER